MSSTDILTIIGGILMIPFGVLFFIVSKIPPGQQWNEGESIGRAMGLGISLLGTYLALSPWISQPP